MFIMFIYIHVHVHVHQHKNGHRHGHGHGLKHSDFGKNLIDIRHNVGLHPLQSEFGGSNIEFNPMPIITHIGLMLLSHDIVHLKICHKAKRL